jgi:hypothetical protein
MSSYIKFNPVLQGTFNLNFQVNKTIYLDTKAQKIFEVVKEADRHKYQMINSSLPYNFYHLDNPYLKEYDEKTWQNSTYYQKTETRDFQPGQVQFCVLRKHSDRKMAISAMGFQDLKNDIMEKHNDAKSVNISL